MNTQHEITPRLIVSLDGIKEPNVFELASAQEFLDRLEEIGYVIVKKQEPLPNPGDQYKAVDGMEQS